MSSSKKAQYLLAVDDVVLVEVLEGEQDVRRVERRILEFESLAVANVEVQLAPHAVVQDEVEPVSVFEGVLELHDEGVLRPLKNASLREGVTHLAELPDALLLEHLHGIVLASLLVQNEEDFAVGALSEQDKGSEVAHGRLVGVYSSSRLYLVDDVLV